MEEVEEGPYGGPSFNMHSTLFLCSAQIELYPGLAVDSHRLVAVVPGHLRCPPTLRVLGVSYNTETGWRNRPSHYGRGPSQEEAASAGRNSAQ